MHFAHEMTSAVISRCQVAPVATDSDRRFLHALSTHFVAVLCVRRQASSTWFVLYAAGESIARNDAWSAADAPLSDAVAWLPAASRARLMQALADVADGAPGSEFDCEDASEPLSPRHLRLGLTPMPSDGGHVDCVITAKDVTNERCAELRHAEQSKHWAFVSAATGLGVITYDIDAQVLHLDATARSYHGVDLFGDDGLPLDVWLSYLVAEDRPAALALLTTAWPPEQRESFSVRLQRIENKPDKVLELAFCATPDRARLVGSCRDVSKERMVDEMRRKKLVAERASKAKSVFMSQVSHELRTPLNGILGFAQIMLMDTDQPLADEQRKRVEVLLYSGRRLLTLIDQLLEVSRIEQGKRAINIRSVNVASIVRRCVEQIQPVADDAGIAIHIDLPDADKAAVRADPGALEQVLSNLLTNAIKYNRPHGKVRIRLLREETSAIVVDDTGHGISDSEMGRLFEPFNRLSAQKSNVQGHGLGLVITRQLVAAMGGELRVASEVGLGSSFSVHLPTAIHSRFDASGNLPLDLPSRWDSETRFVVLYVEDDPVNTLLMEHLFTTQPAWTLHTMETGGEGLQWALHQHVDLVLLDLNLPDMSGQDVLRHLRADARTRHIPCVAVSADAMPGQIRRALAEGFDDYWVKPLELSGVISKLKGLLAG